MNTEAIQELLYSSDLQSIKEILSACDDSATLHTYAYNYNWNNGFEIPQAIIDNPACTLGTALMVFYLADGYRYLADRNFSSEIPGWLCFVSTLHTRIVSGSYSDTSIAFSVPLSKVQIFKLRKQLSENENIFIASIDGTDCDISL